MGNSVMNGSRDSRGYGSGWGRGVSGIIVSQYRGVGYIFKKIQRGVG